MFSFILFCIIYLVDIYGRFVFFMENRGIVNLGEIVGREGGD